MNQFNGDYIGTLMEFLEGTRLHISDINPSDWYEKNMVMPRGSAFPGPFKFDLTPYWREPLDCAAKNHPAKEVSIMKGAQLGGTVAVLNPIVGYTISQNPGNLMFLTGHSDLSEASVLKIDQMIDNCGLRKLIKPNVLRAKNSRTGDTNKSKEFSGGDFKSGSVTNHNLLRQHDVMIMIVDDYDAAQSSSKFAGATRELVQKRTSAFAHKKKIYWVSSPQAKGNSNIEQVFLLGDQRYYNVPCPCCAEFIVLDWEIPVDGGEKAGIYWKLDSFGRVDRKSVGYICQKCAGFFTDSSKYEMNLHGFWKPTATPKEEDHYSYHISSLYAPPGMDDWAYYATQYIAAYPPNAITDEAKAKTFHNVVLGLPYEAVAVENTAKDLILNLRGYEVGIIPEKQSILDGNGKIILLTLSSDLNGKEDDARIDWEVVAWSEAGSSYSILQGSCGSFIPRETAKTYKIDREKKPYDRKKPNNVWLEFDKIAGAIYETDTGRRMKIFITGIDVGYLDTHVYDYIDNCNNFTVGLKGDKDKKYRKYGVDTVRFHKSKAHARSYMVEVNQVKDELSALMKLKWNQHTDDHQPAGFMNYPQPSGGMYDYSKYFEQFESEKKFERKDKESNVTEYRWEKKVSTAQNHFWDVRVYALVLRDIVADIVFRELKIKNGTWTDYVNIMTGRG